MNNSELNVRAAEVRGCKFVEAWRGRCAIFCEGDYCEKHAGVLCCSCGKQATRTCPETFGLVCGAPLCEDCEHGESGTLEHKPRHALTTAAIEAADQLQEVV